MKLLIVCSSSGGHVYPGLAFGNYLKKVGESVSYLGIKGQIEEKILINEDLILLNIEKSFKKNLNHPLMLIKERNKAESIVSNYDVIIGFGGFISFFVSTLKNCKVLYLHEANVDIGDANKYSLSRAKRLFTSFPITISKRFKDKILLTGNPVCNTITNKKNHRNYISFIFGSLGSITLLDKTIDYLLNQEDDNCYLLITSNKYYHYAKDKLLRIKNVDIYPQIDKNVLYESSKVIFCRGGASTLAEILQSQTYAVCIPSPYVKHNHQYHNAEYLYSHHVIQMLLEENYSPENIKRVIEYYKNSPYAHLEKENQKSFTHVNPCLNMYMQIKYDKNHQ